MFQELYNIHNIRRMHNANTPYHTCIVEMSGASRMGGMDLFCETIS